ncbi:MAG: hypothetical protein JW850_24045 [Thermoflexales bacterium]|nr:hypothetical protein [Thermoflexales bacterium]
MSQLERCFWNASEKRLRAGWRLALQLALNLGGAAVFAALVVPHTPLDRWPRLAREAVGYPVLLAITLFSVWVAGRFVDRRAWRDFGLVLTQAAWWADFGAGLAVGFVLVALVAANAAALGVIRLELSFTSGIAGLAFPAAALLAAVGYIAAGFLEELARAYQVRNLFEGLSGTRLGLRGAALAATCGAALVSVAMHSGAAAFILFVFVSMSVQGLFYLFTTHTALVTGYHVAWDFTLATLFGIEALTQAEYTGLFTPRLGEVAQMSASGIHIAHYPLLVMLALAAAALQVAAWLALLGWVRWRMGDVRVHAEMARPSLLS